MKVLRCTLLICGIAATLSVAVFFWRLSALAADARSTVAESHILLSNADQRISDTSQNLNAVLIQWGLASDELRRASIEQRTYLRATSKQAVELMKHANQVVATLDVTAQHLNANQDKVAEKLSVALDKIPPTLESSQRLMDTTTSAVQIAGNRLDDPHLAHTIAEADEAMGHVDVTIGLAQREFEDWIKPVSKAKKILTTVGSWAAQKLFFDLIP